MSAVEEFARREGPGSALAEDADAIALAARDMADRVRMGATLFALGNAADAQHVAVEFVHPVIVGKQALPAIAVSDVDQLAQLAKRGDIALGISTSLQAAQDLGLLTIALVGDGETVAADHVFVAHSDDPLVVSEIHVSTYHLLWELTHVFLEHSSTNEQCGSDEVCITCSDDAVEVTVVELLGDGLALVDTGSSRAEVSVALVDAEVGARLLVHAKEAIARIG